MCIIIRKEALKSKETPKPSEATTFNFPSMRRGLTSFARAIFSLSIIENSNFSPNKVFNKKIYSDKQ